MIIFSIGLPVPCFFHLCSSSSSLYYLSTFFIPRQSLHIAKKGKQVVKQRLQYQTTHFSPRLIFHGYHVSWNQISRSVSEQLRTYLPPTLTTNNGQQVGQGKGRFAVPRHWHWSKFNKELNKFYWDYMYMVITPRGILRRDENFHGDLSCKAAFSPQIVT